MNQSNSLPLHPKTKKQAGLFSQRPTSPLLILGERGSGKLNLAYSVANAVMGLASRRQLNSYPYFFHVKKPEDKQDISIDTIRAISRFLRLKTPGDKPVRRVILIEDSNFLSPEAQSALLKMLEEPNADSLFILTAPSELSLLPTIVSRCQRIRAHPVTLSQALEFYNGQFGQRPTEAAWRLSHGNASLLQALLTDEDSHPFKQAVENVKSFLGKSPYERLLSLDKVSKNRDEFRLFMEALLKILSALHRSAVDKKKSQQAKNLVADRKLVLSCLDALDKNVNSRLLSLSLVLKLKS